MKRVILSVINTLETDQRVNKVALALARNGYRVMAVGSTHRQCHDYCPGEYGVTRLNVIFKHGFLFYAEFNIRLLVYLLCHGADIIVADDTDTLAASYLAARLKGCKIVADLHELFPEVPEVTNRKTVKKFWTKIEDWFLPKVDACYTVCKSIADYYHSRYGIRVDVIRNVPMKRAYDGKGDAFKHLGGKKVILYQGAVNVGRGIEWLIDAMEMVDNAVFVVIGSGDLDEAMRKKAACMKHPERVVFMGQMQHSKLWEYTRSADLGVCLLDDIGLSYHYALPNRIFDFMQVHVPILASDLPEIARVVKTYNTGRVVKTHNPAEIADALMSALNTRFNESDFDRGAAECNWEEETKSLLRIYSKL